MKRIEAAMNIIGLIKTAIKEVFIDKERVKHKTKVKSDFYKNNRPMSNCCGVEIYNTDYDICPNCGEHCEFEYDDE